MQKPVAVTVVTLALALGLEAPSRPGELDGPVREVNVPSATAVSSQER